MKVTPVRRCPLPRYPTAAQAALEPALLARSRHLPVKELGVTAALLVVLGASVGCSRPAGTITPSNGIVRTDGTPPIPPTESVIQLAGEIMPAPMLNEDDVLTILRNEAERLGITFEEDAVTLTTDEQELTVDLCSADGKLAVATLYAGEEPGQALKGDEAPALSLGSVARLTDDTGESVDTLVLAPIYEGQDEEVREAFRQFIDWLKAEGVL